MKILIVEDDPIAIKIAGMIIKRTDPSAESTFAKTGDDALSLSERQNFDLILLDIGLPDCNGYDIAIKMRSIEHNENTPIYMLSAHIKAPSELCPQALSSITGFISKPLSFDKFKDIIASITSEVI
jgi:CheY-like chemotaxis protein